MLKEPELTDVDVYAHDYPERMEVLDLEVRKSIQKGQQAQLIFPTFGDKRSWVRFSHIMDGGLVGVLMEDIGEGLKAGERVFFQYRHIWDMNTY